MEDSGSSSWLQVPAGKLRADQGCGQAYGTVAITFNALGGANKQYICVMDEAGQRRFQLGTHYSKTGRIVVRR